MWRTLLLWLYRFVAAPVGVLLAMTLGAIFIPKVREGLRLRRQRHLWPKFDQPPIWIHASSGEFEYAKPFIREVKAREPHMPVVVTYFSPTYAKSIAGFPGVDFSLPLPLDLPGPVLQFLNRIKPRAGFLARTDLWPEMLYQAHAHKVPVVLFSVTKTKPPSFFPRLFHRWLYSYLNSVLCVTEADAANVTTITGAVPVQAIGDTRFDQVLLRLQAGKRLREELRPPRRTTLVAGSTWNEDEEVLLGALQRLLIEGRLQLILAPHEPTESHVQQLLRSLTELKIPAQLYSKAEEFKSGVLIVDQVGILAELYQWGSLALIGGSYRGSVHSVMEPLAAGCLTIVGPYHHNNREALEFQNLKTDGVPFVQVAPKAPDLLRIVEQHLSDPSDLSGDIRAEIARRGGASRKLADLALTL